MSDIIEALEEIKATAATSLKPDVYPTEEGWQRSRLLSIEVLATKALRERDSLYVPGELRCPQCDFRLSKRVLCASNGAVGVDVSLEVEYCPNDETEMVRLTWKDACTEQDKVIEQLLERLAEQGQPIM